MQTSDCYYLLLLIKQKKEHLHGAPCLKVVHFTMMRLAEPWNYIDEH